MSYDAGPYGLPQVCYYYGCYVTITNTQSCIYKPYTLVHLYLF